MDLISGKKVAAVRLEGTVTDKTDVPFDIGLPRPGAVEALRALQAEGYHVILISSLTKTQHGTRIAFKYVADNAIPYDEIFCSFGLPAAEKWFDNAAEKLVD